VWADRSVAAFGGCVSARRVHWQLAGFPGLHKAESEGGSYIVVGFGPESAAQLLSLAIYMQARQLLYNVLS
jgi:hypothetical protein